jgi:hypothetical protein
MPKMGTQLKRPTIDDIQNYITRDMKTTDTQNKMILVDLVKGDRITPMDALMKYNCFRLSARIYDLRHDFKAPINSRLVEGVNGKRYAEYWIDDSAYDDPSHRSMMHSILVAMSRLPPTFNSKRS